MSVLATANDRLPAGPWWLTWAAAALTACLAVAGYEKYWRSRHFVPIVSDDSDLWIMARDRVRPFDPHEVVLLGDSRCRFAFDLDTFGQAFNGRPPVQLSVNDWSCLPALADLSEDDSFRGLLICEVTPRLWFRDDSFGGLQAQYVRRRRTQTLLAGLERWLRLQFQERFVFRHPDLTPTWLVERWSRGLGLPRAGFIVSYPDRSMRADFIAAGPDRLARQLQLNRTLAGDRGNGIDPGEFPAFLTRLEAMVARIRARGSEVVFVQMPTAGIVHALEESLYPRGEFWDRLSSSTHAIAILCDDFPELSNFVLLDESHLDRRDVPRFSEAFARVLATKLRERNETQFLP